MYRVFCDLPCIHCCFKCPSLSGKKIDSRKVFYAEQKMRINLSCLKGLYKESRLYQERE